MNYKNNRSGNGGFISLHSDNEEIGRLTYTLFPEDEKMIVSFVLVHSKFEGRGMGKFLVEEAVKFARENHWKIEPHCSYARSVLQKMPDVEDILLRK